MAKKANATDMQPPTPPAPEPVAPPEAATAHGELLIRVEHYLDAYGQVPLAARRFRNRIARFVAFNEAVQWGTVVLDTVTSMELAFRMEQKKVLNSKTADPRQWFAGATDDIEELIVTGFGSLSACNVVVLAHVEDSKNADESPIEGLRARNPSAPGRLRTRLGTAYPEIYRSFITVDDSGHHSYWLQTRYGGQWAAASQIPAPNPCPANYQALWPEGEEPYVTRFIIAGEWGSGKSTLVAATFPTPILVFMFDYLGKERPYTRLGRVEKSVDDGIFVENVYVKGE